MQKATFERVRKVMTGLLAAGVGWAAIQGKLWLAVLLVVMAVLVLIVLKRQTRAVVEDERNKIIGEKAARLTVSVVAVSLAMVSLLLVSLAKETEPYVMMLGMIFSYMAIFVMGVYSLSYWWFEREMSAKDDE